MSDVTEKVKDVTGPYVHPGKFEGGTNFDESLIALGDPDEYHGTVDEAGYIGLVYFTNDMASFLPDQPTPYSDEQFVDAHSLAIFVRSAVFVEDSHGFIHARYFDTAEDGETYFGKIVHELYPNPDYDPDFITEGREILREVD